MQSTSSRRSGSEGAVAPGAPDGGRSRRARRLKVPAPPCYRVRRVPRSGPPAHPIMQRSPLSRAYQTFNLAVGLAGILTLLAVSVRDGIPGNVTTTHHGLLPVVLLLVFIGARFFKFDIPPNITVSLV